MTDLVQRLYDESRDNPDSLEWLAANRIEQLEAEVLEQCRINGMGAERELALMAKVERLERENAELRKDAERYRWLVANRKSWAWQPSAYNKEITSGFSAYGTGYLGFSFEAAIDEAMK
jgi:hypothetical protein